ncbi:MAG: penicillin-binding transpeptidase domain-containing protein [Ruminococcus flavefaciens]|nr:penicillin-binding transpeptidase domain-containing protein [Ruminococcus flavefaciens]
MKFGKKEFISLFLAGIITATAVSCGEEKALESSISESEPDAEPVIMNAKKGSFMETPDFSIMKAETRREQGRNTDTAVFETTATTSKTTTTTTTFTAYTASGSTTTTTTALPVIDVSQSERGNIYDTNGIVLVKSEPDGNRKYSVKYGTAFGNIISEISGGVEMSFNDILSASDPYSDNPSERLGKSVQLTLDADIQDAIYQYMQNVNIVGSVVVLRTDGSVMADVSYPSFDPEEYYSNPEYIDIVGYGALENKSMQKQPPGSCFKIMTEIIADKHEIYSLYDDGTWYSDEGVIVDWDHDKNNNYPMERSLYSAFVNSSNIFFAKVFDQLGEETVRSDLQEIFHFGDGCDIECDFGTIESSMEITCMDDLRRSAFGQAHVRTSPMFLATLCREAIFGDMVRPFMLKNVIDSSGAEAVLLEGSKPYDIITSVPENCRQNILDGMLGVGSDLGIYAGENYTFYAKTGTAETGGYDILYITGCMKNVNDNSESCPVYDDYSNYHENGSYIVVMQMQNPNDYGFNFSSESAYLYQGIINILANQ